MKNVLDLEEFNILHEYVDNENKIRKFEVDVKNELFLCTKCGTTYDLDGTFEGKKFNKHDTRKRTVKDLKIRGYKIIIEINQRRYLCPDCRKPYPYIRYDHNRTIGVLTGFDGSYGNIKVYTDTMKLFKKGEI